MNILRGTRTDGPSSLIYTAAQMLPGFTGLVSQTKNAARVYGVASRTLWAGLMTGTEAFLTITSESGSLDTLLEVSIDGGTFSTVPRVGSVYTLFSGLSHGQRFVAFRYGASFGNGPYMASAGDVLELNGDGAVSMTPFANWVQPEDGNTTAIASAALTASTADYLPTTVPTGISEAGRNIPSVSMRGTFSELVVVGTGRYVFVSVDGAAPTRYDTGFTQGALRARRVSGLSGLHTYTVWDGKTSAGSYPFALGVVGGSVSDIASKRRMDAYGASTVEGVGSTSGGDTDVFATGVALGFTPSQYGIGGNTIAALKARIDALLALKTVSSNDVAVLHIGRNNTGGSFDAGEIADYQYIVDALLTKGYGFVLCTGLYIEGAQAWAAENASIEAIVDGYADPSVLFVDVSTWSGIDRPDNVHPSDAGYATISGYAVSAYTTLLGL